MPKAGQIREPQIEDADIILLGEVEHSFWIAHWASGLGSVEATRRVIEIDCFYGVDKALLCL